MQKPMYLINLTIYTLRQKYRIISKITLTRHCGHGCVFLLVKRILISLQTQ